jgi:hypothetical protein
LPGRFEIEKAGKRASLFTNKFIKELSRDHVIYQAGDFGYSFFVERIVYKLTFALGFYNTCPP